MTLRASFTDELHPVSRAAQPGPPLGLIAQVQLVLLEPPEPLLERGDPRVLRVAHLGELALDLRQPSQCEAPALKLLRGGLDALELGRIVSGHRPSKPR